MTHSFFPQDSQAAPVPSVPSRAETLGDAAVHLVGLAAALVAVPVLVTLAAQWHGNVTALLATGIYGATLIAMLVCSALYHHMPRPDWKPWLLRLDHSAIYLKIAGTYTPFALLSGGAGGGLVAGLWGAAVAGCGLHVFALGRARWPGFALYLGMGWAGLVLGWSLFATLSPAVLALIVAGGVIYTIGTAFFLWENLPFHTAIWHGFVLLASVLFFVAVTLHLSDTALGTAVPVL
ncbi:Hly-III family protein [Meridianimarinicoccus roseus]|uniref:Hly-III family protein n=1 Tax=Meridianimarinicoccus roseus TaxID=2072018 RepID=A0A2V2LLC4_9RHOB|nr:hemolysin III family protein [Meridianimarinicoccus roseus]PWR03867.1 Hly-III family protein [Meridianimarinicoccus roseus]